VQPTAVYAWSFEFSIGYETPTALASLSKWSSDRPIKGTIVHVVSTPREGGASHRCRHLRIKAITDHGWPINPPMRHRLVDVKSQFRILNWFLIENIGVGGHYLSDFTLMRNAVSAGVAPGAVAGGSFHDGRPRPTARTPMAE
jgi:hypothetical protein